MHPLLGHSITYRIAMGPQAGRKVFTLQTLPGSDEGPLVPPLPVNNRMTGPEKSVYATYTLQTIRPSLHHLP